MIMKLLLIKCKINGGLVTVHHIQYLVSAKPIFLDIEKELLF